MKLNQKEIDAIVDDASDYICDDLWSKFDSEWVEYYLLNTTTSEYDNEDVNLILKELKKAQKEMQRAVSEEEKDTLYQTLDEYIDSLDIHLSLVDIGKVLVNLACSYLGK